MIVVNQQHLKRMEKFSILTIPNNMNYAGYRTIIPNKFISKNGFIRYINLKDEQKLKIKKNENILMVTVKEIQERA